MAEPFDEIEVLRRRLQALVAPRTEQDERAGELAAEAVEELSAVIEEMQSQNRELVASREALVEERHRYRSLFEAVPDGYLITDGSGMIVEANGTACAMFGRPRSKIVGRPLATFVNAPDQRAFYAMLNRIGQQESGGQQTLNVRVKDHRSVPANLRATLEVSDSIAATRIRWLIHDRTSEIGTEELRASEERLRALFDAADVGIVLGDTDGNIHFINQYAAGVLRFRVHQADTTHWLHATHPDDRARVERLVAAASTVGESGSTRHRVVHGDTYRWVDHSVVPFCSADGSVTGFVSTLADVTVEHDAMVDLQASRDFTAALLDTVGVLVVVLDRSGGVLRFNRSCELLTGQRTADVLGRTLVDVLLPEDQRDGATSILPAVTTPGHAVENDWLKPDGTCRRISWTNATLTSPDGSVAAIIGTGIDVTDQRLLESRIAQVERLDSIGRLAAGIAHDFNNTLATLRLRVDRLSARELDPDGRADLAAVSDTIDRSQRLIADLLSFGRSQDLHPVPTDVNAETIRIADMLANLLDAGIEVELDLTDLDTTAFIDPGRFERILTNLALNAKDAMPTGGRITITTTIDEIVSVPTGSRSAAPGLRPGRFVKVAVADTGTGIRPEDLAHIFDPYFTTKSAGRGTGLGLATTYGTINQTGGAIVADSRVGAGTTITFWLPQSSPERGASSEPIRRRPAAGVVLVVEDDDAVREVIVDELGLLGYDTYEAGDAAEAFEHLGDAIDVLLTDVQLPGMSGSEIAARFRTEHHDLAIVFMSGIPSEGLRPVVPAAVPFLRKPFTADQLADAIRRGEDERDALA